MQRFFRSIAMIRKPAEHRLNWLARRDDRAGWYDFIGAEPLEGESFRECIDREVGWVLDLERERDYLVSNMAQINLEFRDRLPGESHTTHFGVAFYVVELYRKAAWSRVDADDRNRWLTAEEIHRGETNDGQPISPTLVFLVRRSEVIQPWQ